MSNKKKQLKEALEFVEEIKELSAVLQRLLDSGYLDNERVADLIASDLITNPYGLKPDTRFMLDQENKKL